MTKTKSKPSKKITIAVRVTPEIERQLRAVADKEHRALGAQVLYFVEQALKCLGQDDIIELDNSKPTPSKT